MAKTPEKYLTIKAVSESLSCTERHIYDLIVIGDLSAIKIGARAVRIAESSLTAFITRRRITPEDFFAPEREAPPTPSTPQQAPQVARSKWMKK